MSNFQKILDSFTLRDTLNPKIWENPEDPAKSKMKPKVRKALMKIANEFIDYLGDDAFVEDITLTGSLSNFNWSEYSDFDLHIIVDLKKFGKQEDTYKELFNLKKQLFNEKHDIKIFDYDVELYAQGDDEKHESSGVYSLMEDEWINKPQKMKNEIDKSVIEDKVKNWNEKIENALESLDKGDLEKGKKKIEDLKEKLKEYRKSGLEKEGELSYENLTFKFLRRNGMIEKLFNTYNNYIDQELSMEQSLKEAILKYIDKGEETINEQIDFNEVIGESQFLKSLLDISDKNKKFEYYPSRIVYDKDVELIQKALQHLGFSLPKWGIDGKYGPETENAVKNFQKAVKIIEDGKLDGYDMKYLVGPLIVSGFKDSNLSDIQTQKEIDTTNISDKNFYERLLKELGAPVTSENMKFLYAWRQAEGKGGRYNPFNTTWKLPGSTNMNKVGVQHYKSLEDGMIATLKTLRNGRYSCIVDGLRNDVGASQISMCSSLKTWGTGDLVAKVVNNYERGASPRIKDLA